MAAARVSSDLPKPSFAKVAASVTKDSAPNPVPRRIASPAKEPPTASTSAHMPTAPVIANGGSGRSPIPQSVMQPKNRNNSGAGERSADVDKLSGSFDVLTLNSKAPSLVVNGSGQLSVDRSVVMPTRDSGSDDSQKADSGSDLGTKPPSIDGKSITSGTTFALDEKESLRPDDSASVKAAEDDDTFSVRGSLIAGSRMGSEVAARARGHLGDIPERRLPQQGPGAVVQGVLTPQSSSSGQPPGASSAMPLDEGVSSDALNVIYRQAPDEKLLEAMTSPKDRLFLLRLENQVIDFVQNSKEPYMDLPPSNSFCRLLTHKLADYYHMTHSYEPHVGSVRIFRTPFCRVPRSLATINPNPTAPSGTPPPVVLPRKIMRRGQDSEGGLSTNPSKPTSETGSDSKDKTPATNQKLTREEREEMYKLARERIFGNSEENTTDNDGENGVSRTSSTSAKDKSTGGKRGKTGKQRRDDSDSFDSRHQYTPYWGPQQQTWVPQPQYVPPPNPQYGAQAPQPPYQGQMAPVYAQQQQAPAYPAMPGMMPPAQQFTQYPMPPYQAPPNQPRYPPSGSPMTNYGAPAPPPPPPPAAAPQQAWQQPGFPPSQFQSRGAAASGPLNHLGIPYAFGQLPANVNPNDPKSQHPIPGSYNRNHAFNPMTQSFVPGNNSMGPVPPPQPPFTAPGSHHGSPQVGSPHLAYPGYQQPMPQPYGGGYGMVRQGSSNSMPAYHSPHIAHVQHAPPPMPPNPPHMAPQPIPQNPPAHIPNRPNVHPGPNPPFTHLPTYGNPATLPQKPATGI